MHEFCFILEKNWSAKFCKIISKKSVKSQVHRCYSCFKNTEMNLKANCDLAECQKAEITKKIFKCSSRKPRDNRRTSDDISAVIYFLCEFRPRNIIKFGGKKSLICSQSKSVFVCPSRFQWPISKLLILSFQNCNSVYDYS